MAEQASRTKSAFLANMSHELRTPLNAIIGYSEMLVEEAQDMSTQPGGAEVEALFVPDLKKINSAGKHLLALINDILDLSKIESGKMDVEVGNVRFAELQDYCVRTFRHVAEGKGIAFCENNMAWHHQSKVTAQDVERLLAALEAR